MTDWTKRLAIVSDEASDSFADAVHICLPLGIRAYELRKLGNGRFPDVPDDTIAKVIETVQTHALTLVGVSPGFFKASIDDPATRAALDDGFPRAFRLMDRLGVRRMTVFSFRREGGRDVPVPPAIFDYLGEARDRCQREGVELLIENSASSWGDTGANLATLAQTLGVKVTWDPGNAAASGEIAYPDGYRAMRDHLAHVHFKNWQPDSGNVAIADGIVDMAAQVAALKADGYAGYYCVEPHQWHDRENATRRNSAQLLALLEKEPV